ncbi:MAG: hypothetical protein SWX82_06570 [Cyanobacteriota bacterium]|nr:hypothetical protein [Cyanobacteriota bacterium]
MKYHAFISFLEICWVGATLCIFSRQIGIWRRQVRKKKNIVVTYSHTRHLRKRYRFFAGVGNRQQLIWQQVRYFYKKGAKKDFLG